MNKLPDTKRVLILNMLCAGSSLRTISRTADVSINTVSKLLVDAGKPHEEHVSTSYVERQNLTMRMHMRRFTRLTNAFSKKFENHLHMVSLYSVWYNFVRQHKTLRTSPAMAAGLSDRLWGMEDIVALIDTDAAKPSKRGKYKKRNSN